MPERIGSRKGWFLESDPAAGLNPIDAPIGLAADGALADSSSIDRNAAI
jgi:hypothetical protein